MSRPKLQSVTMTSFRCLLALCVFGLLFGSEVAAMRGSKRDSKTQSRIQATAANDQRSFEIAGEIDGLYPGANVPLNVRVTNPHRNPLRVRSVDVEVRDSDRAGCGREWVRPGRDATISTLVPPRSTASVSFPVSMLDDAPEICQGATWVLAFSGTGMMSNTQAPPDDDDDPPNNIAGPSAPSDHGSVLPFTGSSLIAIAVGALTSILFGLMLLMRRRSGDEA